jgi:hypothetical protein
MLQHGGENNDVWAVSRAGRAGTARFHGEE